MMGAKMTRKYITQYVWKEKCTSKECSQSKPEPKFKAAMKMQSNIDRKKIALEFGERTK